MANSESYESLNRGLHTQVYKPSIDPKITATGKKKFPQFSGKKINYIKETIGKVQIFWDFQI